MFVDFLAVEKVYENCKTEHFPWSIITSSPPNGSLAAVLAGFMMTAAIFLLRGDGGTENSAFKTHTLASFGSGVLVLGLDAYLFGNISASAPVVSSADRSVADAMSYPCALAWTDSMPASSMLAVGACLMLNGLAWMLAHQFALLPTNRTERSAPLLVLPGLMIGTVLVTSSLLLVRTAVVYLAFMDDEFEKGPGVCLLEPLCWILWGLFFLVTVCIIIMRTRSVIKQKKTLTNLALVPHFKALATASIGTAVLAVLGPVYASFADELGGTWFVSEGDNLPTTFSIYIAFALVLLPIAAIMLPIALAAPTVAAPTNGPRAAEVYRVVGRD